MSPKSIFAAFQLVCERRRSLTSPNSIPGVLIRRRCRRAATCISRVQIKTRWGDEQTNNPTKHTTRPLRCQVSCLGFKFAHLHEKKQCLSSTNPKLGSERPLKTCINFPTSPVVEPGGGVIAGPRRCLNIKVFNRV